MPWEELGALFLSLFFFSKKRHSESVFKVNEETTVRLVLPSGETRPEGWIPFLDPVTRPGGPATPLPRRPEEEAVTHDLNRP